MRHRKLVLLAAAWVIAVGSGLWAMFEYEMTPGEVAATPVVWPAASVLDLHRGHPTFVMFVHPHCPCTRASLDELMILATRRDKLMKTIVVFLKPTRFEQDWEKTDLWKTAASIPGATLFSDVAGKEIGRFGATVSGESLLYDPAGNLIFHGGITPSRGHRGDNAGLFAVEALVAGEATSLRQTPVFGCSLCERKGSLNPTPRPVNR
jgi:hypothetical protein